MRPSVYIPLCILSAVFSLAVSPAMVAAFSTNTQHDKPSRNTEQRTAMIHDLFTFSSADAVVAWSPTDDRVMGGISRSRMRFHAGGYALFEGVMSLQQNGGFASVRAAAKPPPLAGVSHYVVEVRGDGKRYKLSMRTAGRFDAVSYQSTFATVADSWTTVAIPVHTFVATFRGRRVIDAPPLDAAKVNQVGLMIADGQDGPFQLAVRRISVELQ